MASMVGAEAICCCSTGEIFPLVVLIYHKSLKLTFLQNVPSGKK